MCKSHLDWSVLWKWTLQSKWLLENDSSALAKLVDQLYKNTGELVAPFPYSKFFSELAQSSPVCGIFQYCGNLAVLNVLSKITSSKINVFDSTNLQLLQENVPLMASFLSQCSKEADGNISQVLLVNCLKLLGMLIMLLIAHRQSVNLMNAENMLGTIQC